MGKEIISYKSRIGQDFGYLLVLEFLEERKQFSPYRKTYKYLCRCVCGAEVKVMCADIVRGATKSCGCKKYKHRHQMSYQSEYKIWSGIKARCLNESIDSFKYYGARGIKVCDRWLKSFDNFFSDMGPRPSKKHSIDRIDNDGNYEPANCRWATAKQQYANRRQPKFPQTELKCCGCGKKFLKPSYLAKGKIKHACSSSCKQTGKEVACNHCGKYFYVRHGLIGKTKFCNKECYFNSRYPNRIKECDLK